MLPVRLPAAALPALRGRIDIFLRTHGVRGSGGQARLDVELHGLSLAGFLLAVLRYTREEHPWLGRSGSIVEPPEEDPPGADIALWSALDEDAPGVDDCLSALRQIVPFEVEDAPSGRRRARPRPYRWALADVPEAFARGDVSLDESVFGVVAEEGWIQSAASRDEVFQEVLPPNESGVSFVEIDGATAVSLAQFLFAGPHRPVSWRAYRAQAQALVGLFGKGARAFAPRGLDIDDDESPFTRGTSWSQYNAAGNGSWGSTASVLVSDGTRVAFVEAVWGVSSE